MKKNSFDWIDWIFEVILEIIRAFICLLITIGGFHVPWIGALFFYVLFRIAFAISHQRILQTQQEALSPRLVIEEE